MEPFSFAAFLMFIYTVPFNSFVFCHTGKFFADFNVVFAFDCIFNNLDISHCFITGNTKQLLDIRAHITDVECVLVNHQENIIDIVRKHREQLFTVFDFGILKAYAYIILADKIKYRKKAYKRNKTDASCYCNRLKFIQVFVYYFRRNYADKYPVLEADLFICYIVHNTVYHKCVNAGIVIADIGTVLSDSILVKR